MYKKKESRQIIHQTEKILDLLLYNTLKAQNSKQEANTGLDHSINSSTSRHKTMLNRQLTSSPIVEFLKFASKFTMFYFNLNWHSLNKWIG